MKYIDRGLQELFTTEGYLTCIKYLVKHLFQISRLLSLTFSITDADGSTVYRETVFFVKKSKFRKSLRDVHCRASVLGTTYEKSVNIQVTCKT